MIAGPISSFCPNCTGTCSCLSSFDICAPLTVALNRPAWDIVPPRLLPELDSLECEAHGLGHRMAPRRRAKCRKHKRLNCNAPGC